MSVNYLTSVDFDPFIIDVDTINTDTAPTALQGLIKFGVYIRTGSPTVVAGKYIPGAIVLNSVDAESYINNGSTAVPNWKLITHA